MSVKSYTLIDVATKNGKKFENKTKTLINSLCENQKFNEKTRFVRTLSEQELNENSYLCKIFDNMKNNGDKELKDLFSRLELKTVTVGLFGRVGSYNYRNTDTNYFRFFVHFGDPEIYYTSSETVENHGVVMYSGWSFVLDPMSSTNTDVTVYENKVRSNVDLNVCPDIPRIRSPDYKRYTLIYDYEFLQDPLQDFSGYESAVIPKSEFMNSNHSLLSEESKECAKGCKEVNTDEHKRSK